MKYLKKYGNILYPVISLSVIIGIWAIFARIVNIEIIVPSVKNTFSSLGNILSDKTFYIGVGNTLLRAIISFSLAMVCAVIFGIICYLFPIFNKLLSPFITIMRAVPTMSIILLTVIWLRPETSPILIAFIIVFPMMYSSVYSAISNVDQDLVSMSKAYKVSKKDTILKLYLPSIAPTFLDACRANVSLTVKLIISAEVIAQTKISLGIMMQISRSYLETAQLLAYTLLAIFLSYLLEVVFICIKKFVVRWKIAD